MSKTNLVNSISNDEAQMMISSSLPDFADLNNKYTKQLLKGRHPRSFPRQSEMWHH